MKRLSQVTAILTVLLAFASLPADAADPLVYGSNTGYAGAGKHPKTGVTGLVIDLAAIIHCLPEILAGIQ